MTLTEQELAEIEQRAAKATPGPWMAGVDTTQEQEPFDVRTKSDTQTMQEMGFRAVCEIQRRRRGWEDALFLAHARADVPALCALAREHFELKRKLRELIGQREQFSGDLKRAIEALLGSDER